MNKKRILLIRGERVFVFNNNGFFKIGEYSHIGIRKEWKLLVGTLVVCKLLGVIEDFRVKEVERNKW